MGSMARIHCLKHRKARRFQDESLISCEGLKASTQKEFQQVQLLPYQEMQG
jgi:hypothetical protein